MLNIFLCKNILRIWPIPVQCQSYTEWKSKIVAQLKLSLWGHWSYNRIHNLDDDQHQTSTVSIQNKITVCIYCVPTITNYYNPGKSINNDTLIYTSNSSVYMYKVCTGRSIWGMADTPEKSPKSKKPLSDIHIEGHQYTGKTIYVTRRKLKITNHRELLGRPIQCLNSWGSGLSLRNSTTERSRTVRVLQVTTN